MPDDPVKIIWKIPLRCVFGFHRWPEWSTPREGKFDGVKRLYQSRICPDCHRYSWRFV